jgi:hypothetical protein
MKMPEMALQILGVSTRGHIDEATCCSHSKCSKKINAF